MAVGDVLEKGLEFVIGFVSGVVGVLERGLAFGTEFGATMAGVSFAFGVSVVEIVMVEPLTSGYYGVIESLWKA